jgi:hypothetical protein
MLGSDKDWHILIISGFGFEVESFSTIEKSRVVVTRVVSHECVNERRLSYSLTGVPCMSYKVLRCRKRARLWLQSPNFQPFVMQV